MFPWKSKQRFKFWMDREEEGGILEWKLFSFLLFTLKKKENIQRQTETKKSIQNINKRDD